PAWSSVACSVSFACGSALSAGAATRCATCSCAGSARAAMAGRSSRALAVATLVATASAQAQGTVSVENIGFKLADAFEPGAAVSGELRVPEAKRERLPAVLILHGSAGIDGRGASY